MSDRTHDEARGQPGFKGQTEQQHADSAASTPTAQYVLTGGATRAAAARHLALLCDKVPKAYSDWSHQSSVAFKATVMRARRISKGRGASLASIQEQLRALERFHTDANIGGEGSQS